MSNEKFMDFYLRYCKYCGYRKKLSNVRKKTWALEAWVSKNIEIEKRYQQIVCVKSRP